MAYFFPFVAALLLGDVSFPSQQAPADTTRIIRGFSNQPFAWGTLVLRNGRRLQAYLPATTTGLDMMVPYYLRVPDTSPTPRPKFFGVEQVRCMRVQGQYSELISPSKHESGRLAARRLAGNVDLFVVKMTSLPMVSFLGTAPVLSSPATATDGGAMMSWYLRRANGPAVLVNPETFAYQVSAFLADDRELASRIAAGQAGYGLAELESLVQQYNQRARP